MFNLQAEKEECKVFSIQDITREEFKQGTSFKIENDDNSVFSD